MHQMMDRIGTGHKVLWINVYLPDARSLQLTWNAALQEAATEYSGSMFVYDWATFAAENQRWLAKDHLHYFTTMATGSGRRPSGWLHASCCRRCPICRCPHGGRRCGRRVCLTDGASGARRATAPSLLRDVTGRCAAERRASLLRAC